MMSRLRVTSAMVKTMDTRGNGSLPMATEIHTALMQAMTKNAMIARLVRSRKNMSAMRGV